MKKHINIIVILIMIMSVACNCVDIIDKEEPMLEFKLNLNETVYYIGDPIQATLSIKNNGQAPLIFNKRMVVNNRDFKKFGEIAFFITTPLGDEAYFAWKINIHYPKEYDFITLSPSGVLSNTIEINKWYSPLDIPGDYSVYAIYQNYNDPGDGGIAWKGEITSNTVIFTIEP